MPRLRMVLLIALCALVAAPAGAGAATQTKDDAADDTPLNGYGYRTDLRRATWDVGADNVVFDLTVSQDPFRGQFYVFIDTNKDGRSDYSISGSTGEGAGGNQVKFRLETTPQSTTTCQRANGNWNTEYTGQLLTSAGPVDGADNGGVPRYRFTFPTSMLGGAQSFDWAAYSIGFDMMHNRFDYMPDAANFDVSRPNPVTTVKDYCDLDGNGMDDNYESSEAGSVPLLMAQGFTFPDESDPLPGTPGAPGAPGAPLVGWQHTLTDTTRQATMPNVAKLRSDKARARVLAQLGYADFTVREINLAKPPKGVGFGDVVSQKPASGTKLTSGIGSLPRVELTVYAGPRPKGKQDCIDKLAKSVKGMEAVMAVDLLKKAGCRISYDIKLGSSDKETVTKVTPKTGDRVEVQLQIPRASAKQDLFLNVRENPNQLSFDAPRPADGHPGFNLLSSSDQKNCITIQVVDRAGRLVQGAQLRIDATDVGAPSNPSVPATGNLGETPICFLTPKPGQLDIAVWAVGANDIAIYGGHSFTIVDSSKFKTGDRWYTSSGRVLTKGKTGKWSTTATAAATAKVKTVDYGPLVNWLISLFSGNSPQAVQTLSEPTIDAGKKLNTLCGGKTGSCPAVLAVGNSAVGKSSAKLISVSSGQVVAAGGANVVAAGGMNAVAAGGGNVIAAGGLNLIDGASAGVVAAGGANVIAAGGGNVVAAGGANVVAAGGGNVVAAGGGNVVAAGGLNLISIGNAGIMSDNGLG